MPEMPEEIDTGEVTGKGPATCPCRSAQGVSMTIARREIIYDGIEGTYHCFSRCVRRAFLCGYDKLTGRNFDHRKQWIEDRLKNLLSVFAIDLAGKAIMENHFHLVLRNRPDIADSWDDLEVARRWRRLYPTRLDREAKEREIKILSENKAKISELRTRLQSISWFMKSISEHVARRANAEDECKGRFWEGRFKSTELADEEALLACMVYVDLNPIRAELAKTPEESDYTSIQKRIAGNRARERLKQLGMDLSDTGKTEALSPELLKDIELSRIDRWLSPISWENNSGSKGLLSMSEIRYIEIVDYSGRALRSGKKGSIPENLAPILERLNISVDNWVFTITNFNRLFCRASGKAQALDGVASRIGKHWIKGIGASRLVFA